MLERKRKKKNVGRDLVTFILIAVMIFCVYQIGTYLWDSYINNKLNNDLRENYAESVDNSEDFHSRFKPFLEINPDIVGWIKIDNTNIDYPVVQTDNNDFYLNHNIEKENARAGMIFMDYRNRREGTDKNTIIYGHHMKDGSMFKGLVEYKQEQFMKEHPVIEFDTLDEATYWEIFSVYITDASYNYVQTDFIDDEEYENFLKSIKDRSLYDTGVEVSKEDSILTLSTCTYEFDNARFTVHAKKVDAN